MRFCLANVSAIRSGIARRISEEDAHLDRDVTAVCAIAHAKECDRDLLGIRYPSQVNGHHGTIDVYTTDRSCAR